MYLDIFWNSGIAGCGKTVQHNGTVHYCEIIQDIGTECYSKIVLHILVFTGIWTNGMDIILRLSDIVVQYVDIIWHYGTARRDYLT